MRHVCEKFGLVLIRLSELAALVLNLAEQSRVLNRQDRLGGEGLKKIHNLCREVSCLAAINRQTAHNAMLTKERNCKNRPITEFPKNRSGSGRAVFLFAENVSNLHRRAGCRRTANCTRAEAYWVSQQGLRQLLFHHMTSAQMKFFRPVVIFIDRPGIATA